MQQELQRPRLDRDRPVIVTERKPRLVENELSVAQWRQDGRTPSPHDGSDSLQTIATFPAER
jgi:hypothetical protein